ncbi:hypothetical protein ZWY2020_022932 [Hordeum vulgare]|nr:hypothetical protein ZWY2020_022932 [Hordeum vulgare]
MKKFGDSQQQYEAISEVKEASNGIDETQLLNNMLPSSVSPGLASKHTDKQASCTQIMATQSKQEASPTAFQPSLVEATLNATRVVPIQVKKGGNTLSASKAKPGGTQPLGDLTCQVPFSSRGNVKQVGNAFERVKVQDLKASPQAVPLNDAGQEKEKENICSVVSCMEIKREQDKIAETTTNISEQKLLISLGKLPVCSIVDAKHEAKSVSEVVQSSSQENLFHLSDVEDRFQKFMSLSGKTTNALEVNVLDVSELLARFAHPNSKNPQINPTKIEQQHQSDSKRSAAFYSEYCPTPSFDLGIDDLPTTSVDERAHQNDGSSGFDEYEFKEFSVPMHPTIEIIDDDYVLDLEGIDEPCAEARCSAGIVTEQNMYQTPQKKFQTRRSGIRQEDL